MLDAEGRDNIQELLRSPMTIPDEFKTWLLDWLAINIPQIPISQIEGYKNTVARGEQISTTVQLSGAYAEHTWLELDGPQISGLGAGTYYIVWGAHFSGVVGSGGYDIQCGPSINGADPTKFITMVYIGGEHGYPGWRAGVFEVSGNGDNNEVHLEYKYSRDGGTEAKVSHRWMHLLRIT